MLIFIFPVSRPCESTDVRAACERLMDKNVELASDVMYPDSSYLTFKTYIIST